MNGAAAHSFHEERSRSVHTPTGHPGQGYRLSGPTLPGLRDILSPVSRPSPSQMHLAWTPGPPLMQTAEHRSQDTGSQIQGREHLPFALQALHDPRRIYPDAHERAPELQYAEAQPMRSGPPPVSPYGPYQHNGRDYMDARHDRPRQQSTSSYITQSVTSPYTPLTSEELAHRASIVSHDRLGHPPFTPTGAESSRKYLGIKDYPEGSYHVYEGGFRIPTHVDGDTVNPQWGLTKANKPRKRLALACLDCREKKIKCEPGASSCLQCEKAKRICRRAPNQPSSTEGASTTWSSAGSPPQSRPAERVSDPTPQTAHGMEQDATAGHNASAQENAAKRHAQDDPLAQPTFAKKHRSASPVIPSGHTRGPVPSFPPSNPVPTAVSQFSDHSRFDWKVDPYFIDPATTMRLLDLYFAHVNSATYSMFPQHAFLTWVTRARKEGEQCQNERMVLYAMLAMGSIFAGQEVATLGDKCAQIASHAAASKIGSFGLPLVQTRLILSLCNFAKGTDGLSWDLCGLAVSALTALRYNDEEGCKVATTKDGELRPESYVYGFTKEQIAECRRRTFWSGFLMDRYNGLLGGLCCTINTGDIYLRLPCREDMFENSQPSDAPFYNNHTLDPTISILTAASPVSPMAWLVLISAIWGNTMAFIHRSTHHDSNTYREAYEIAYNETETALQGWVSRLPEHMQYSYGNLERAIQGGYAGIFVSIHTLHHFILLKLSRCLRHTLAPDLVPRNIQIAHKSSHQVLRIMCDLQASRRNISQPVPGQSHTFTFSTPFAGYATVSAIDIVGAGGPESNLGPTLDGIAGGTECLRELMQFWRSAHKQFTAGTHRLYQLKNVVSRPFKATSGCWLGKHWGFEGPIDEDIEPDADCIYGINEKIYFAALEETSGKGRPASGSVRIG
ncbi:hypothetical protein B0A48_00975 [Cryoendolithus antarcticus]|uniref:Zn(2)-C6 fungal-type domain-containing protein n=1 Tax=Cryoendolithus antarcticus TaxID=1507870 RepID=A0A1V8TRW7_9PEZI|nr:hypothetical protein B0A48_00975 [Cryoendolithus antarcticus]